MASTPQTFLGFLVLVLVIISLAVQTGAGRGITTNARAHPEWHGHFDGTVLVPGIVGDIASEKRHGPITQIGGGNSVLSPGVGLSAGRQVDGHSHVPGMEVPNPVVGGFPVPSGH